MATVKVKRRHTTGGTASTVDGELSVNSFDKKIFIGNGSSAVEIANQLGYSTIATVGTITSGTWNASTIATNYGGTGLTSFTSGGLLYASSTSALTTGSVFSVTSNASSNRINIASGASPKANQEFKVSETVFSSSAAIGVYTNVLDNPPGYIGRGYLHLISSSSVDSQITLSTGDGSVTISGGHTPLAIMAVPPIYASYMSIIHCIDDATDPYIILGDDGANNGTNILLEDTVNTIRLNAAILKINTSTPAAGKVLTCTNAEGTVEWQQNSGADLALFNAGII